MCATCLCWCACKPLVDLLQWPLWAVSDALHYMMQCGKEVLILIILLLTAVMRFHMFLRLHAVTLVLAMVMQPRLAAALHSSASKWEVAAFVRFGILFHCTVSVVLPVTMVRLIMRSYRKQFILRQLPGTGSDGGQLLRALAKKAS